LYLPQFIGHGTTMTKTAATPLALCACNALCLKQEHDVKSFYVSMIAQKETFCNAIVISVASRSSHIICIVMSGASSSSRCGPGTQRMSRSELWRIVAKPAETSRDQHKTSTKKRNRPRPAETTAQPAQNS
jgi:predicted RNA-binding protein with PIN domain